MNILPLGVGGAFTNRFFHNNFLFDFDGMPLLIDCGTSLRFSLYEAGMGYKHIENVFITHCHFDHVGGLSELVTCRSALDLPTTIYMMQDLYDDVLSVLAPGLDAQTIEQFCQFKLLHTQQPYTLNGYKLELLSTTNLHVTGMLSTGLRITQPDGTQLLYTSDIKKLTESPFRSAVTRQTKLILQDMSFTPNPVHSTFDEVLAYYPKEVQRYIVAMHYDDNIEDYREKIENSPIHLARQHHWIHI